MIAKVVLIIFAIALVGLSILIVFGLTYTQREMAVIVNPQNTTRGKQCMASRTPCDSNADCTVCTDALEMTCQALPRYSDSQESAFGSNGKYCLPTKPRAPCNEKNGGVQVWAGWGDTERMEFDCLCSYPDYFGGPGCENLNPGICAGEGSFDFDARVSTTGPGPSHCKCPEGTNMVVRSVGEQPLCVPEKVFPNYYSGTDAFNSVKCRNPS